MSAGNNYVYQKRKYKIYIEQSKQNTKLTSAIPINNIAQEAVCQSNNVNK